MFVTLYAYPYKLCAKCHWKLDRGDVAWPGGCNRRFTRGMLSFSDPMAMPNRLPNIGIPIQQKLLNACSLLDSANNTKLYILYVSDNAKNDAVFMNMIYTITRQSTFTE